MKVVLYESNARREKPECPERGGECGEEEKSTGWGEEETGKGEGSQRSEPDQVPRHAKNKREREPSKSSEHRNDFGNNHR